MSNSPECDAPLVHNMTLWESTHRGWEGRSITLRDDGKFTYNEEESDFTSDEATLECNSCYAQIAFDLDIEGMATGVIEIHV